MRTQVKILALAALMGLAATVVYAGTIEMGFDNKSDMTLSMYVDGAFGCTALAHLTCTTQVEPGVHSLEAKSGQRTVASDKEVDIEPEHSWWRVFYTNS